MSQLLSFWAFDHPSDFTSETMEPFTFIEVTALHNLMIMLRIAIGVAKIGMRPSSNRGPMSFILPHL